MEPERNRWLGIKGESSSRRIRLRRSIERLRNTTGNLLRRVSNGLQRASTVPSRRTFIPNVPDFSRDDISDWWRSSLNNGTVNESVIQAQENVVSPAGSNTSTSTSTTSTPPEVCLWVSSVPIYQELRWILHSGVQVNTHLLRIASCLRRAIRHLYDVPEEDYPNLQLPVGATGQKQCRMHTTASTYPRGSKGLKKRGDPDVPRTRWIPNGIKLAPIDTQVFQLRGCFFPAPSKLRYTETLNYDEKPKNVGKSHQNLSAADPNELSTAIQSVSGEEPTDYYGPARDYAGGVSSSSDSEADSEDDSEGPEDAQAVVDGSAAH
ncbi:uncharacterized protein LTHEOB_7967 [Lasiodiplodia theobromae]|uniref:uncharacterized protein n=1 Tax=Lasiodiplodia theobromae TaxID=45133 RepID=UPI0015C33FC9|nr:uncharacterized protein LTHEOB_7967 [Lasiodiplodia theobromae]KAF4542285.1 hypothetical protein LTHEOB_7967 [Lasiodiplodia theobromae]